MKTRGQVYLTILTIVVLFMFPTAAYTESPSPFIGQWQAVDVDGSDMRMTIAGGGTGPFQITWTDSYFSFCHGPQGIIRGTGSLREGNPNILDADHRLVCYRSGASVDFHAAWLYDPATDTISGDVGGPLIWHRVPGFIDLVLAPSTLTGDIYLDGSLIVPGVNSTRLHVAPDTPHLVEVKNVTDSTAGFGDLFVYDDTGQANVRVRADQVRQVTLRPRQRYIRGILALTCDVRGFGEGQVVVCRSTVDGTPQPDIAAGAQATYHLTPGSHAVHIDLAGDQASLWAPPSADHTANITAGRTTTLRSTYNRKDLLRIGLNAANVVGDIYLDGVLIASQVASAETFVTPSVSHTVEGKALTVTDPAAAALYRYEDVSAPGWVGANQTRTVALRPRQVYVVGFAAVTCQIVNKQPAEDGRCSIMSDGQPLGTVESGATVTFNLTPGRHVLAATVVGANASRWGISPASQTLTITGGRTSRFTARFNPLPPTPTPAPTGNITGVCTISSDATFGYTKENPIKVGGGDFGGPPRERAYLDNLRGPNGEKISYERIGSIPFGDTILDSYEINGSNKTVILYIDEYVYTEPEAPVGFTCASAFPLTNP